MRLRPPASSDYTPMSDRERQSIRRHQAEIAELERAEREERERPIREAETHLKETANALAKVYRARLLGEVPDPDRYIDPATNGMILTQEAADKYNSAEARKYRAQNPDFYFTDELFDSISSYLDRNEIRLVSATMLSALIERYREAGLLPERPAPEPEPEPTPEPTQPAIPQTFRGFDPETGAEREYSAREVNRMSSEQYRRAFRIYAADLALPNVGPGLGGRRAA